MVQRTADCYEKQNGEYSPESAYINVLLSAVAYSDHPQKCLDQLFPGGGFKLVAGVLCKCNSFLFEYKECFEAVAVSEHLKLIVVANRGTTNNTQLFEEVLTALTIPKQNLKTGGRVQKYFYDAFNLLYPCVSKAVKDQLSSYPDYTVVITGHSLGAAIASLTAVSLVHDDIISENMMTLYTFGMPRVGDKTYASRHDKLVNNSWRIIHTYDYVTRVPLQINLSPDDQPYHHKTEVYYPAVDMPPNASYKICSINEDPSCVRSNAFNLVNFNVDYHTHYFNKHVGGACKTLGARRKRSIDGEEISAMAHLLTKDTCRIIPFDDDISGQNIIHLNFPLILIAIIFLHAYLSFYF
ncbi:hypothetical protein ACF0H5_015495 [Mactra antiquata]